MTLDTALFVFGPQDEGSEERAADDSHDGEGALGEWVGGRLKAESSHLS